MTPLNLEIPLSGRTAPLVWTLLAVSLYLAFSPVWTPGIAPRIYDDARYLELAALALILMQLIRPTVADAALGAWNNLNGLSRILVPVFLAGGLLSAMVSGVPSIGMLEVALVAQLFLLILVMAAIVRQTHALAEAALTVSIFAGASLCLLKFVVTYGLYLFEGKVFPWISPFLEFSNVRFFSQYQAYTLFLVILPATLLATGKAARIAAFLAAAGFWSLHWMVGTRAAWVGLIAGVFVVVVFAKQGRLAWLRAQALAFAGGAILFLVVSQAVQTVPLTAPVPGVKSIVERDQGSINERIELARLSVRFIREYPLTGVGPGQFGLQSYKVKPAHPHNVPLQLLSEYGVPAGIAGTGLGLLLAAFAIRRLRVGTTANADMVGTSVTAALVTGLTDALFSGNLIMPHAQMFFCVLAGWAIGRQPVELVSRSSRNAAARRPAFWLFAIAVLAVGTSTIVAIEYLPLAQDLPAWAQAWNPHFWQYGHFAAW